MKIPITLRYKGNLYTYEEDIEPWGDDRDALYAARYMYNDGNYACDCNKSLFLEEHCGVDFSGEEGYDERDTPLPCGHTIETISPRWPDDPILFLPKKEQSA